MEFLLSEEQLEIQDTVRRFLDKNCPSTRLHEYFDSPEQLPEAIWQGLVEMGVPALIVPEAFGGLGMELLDLAIIAEVLGQAAAPNPLLAHTLATQAIIHAGNDAQRETWLPKLASGTCLASFAAAETGGDWLTPAMSLKDGLLQGEKQHVCHAQHADLIVVALANNHYALIEKDASGLSIIPEDVADRTRPMASLSLDNCPAELLSNSSESSAEKVLNTALVLLAADCFGGAAQCIEMAVDYAKTREQFGQVIGKFQAIKHQLANMAVDVEPMRGLYWHAAYAFDHEPGAASRQAALAKGHLSDRFLHVARETVQAHGGIGYTWECDAQIYIKRALFNYAYMGNAGLHRKRVAELADW
ncbi:acyl-CoA/acyl-ACP dehydrogenase [Spongiibacter nanhainus]|uniref:Acyl-CoA/acyl-ACP dehydrogenase n=1 Tax=Spongiibacter nanhainus TaxID=2794344 RepID=A0A7T4UPS3_9GAMM|nr:acyl-CoA dehydrogenase family protein [Spongiibacter nanhainus]QQD17318.1 acyl-CoA/acyl-ACP dehydrogenase [Spongiibacter nanhainus]